MRSYIPQKYNFIETMFCQHRWCRRLFGGFWIRMQEPGYSWVKFDKTHFYSMTFVKGTNFDIEDYT